jgi:hypothetical protein
MLLIEMFKNIYFFKISEKFGLKRQGLDNKDSLLAMYNYVIKESLRFSAEYSSKHDFPYRNRKEQKFED